MSSTFLIFTGLATHFAAFNIADSVIFMGAALMIFESFTNKEENKETNKEANKESDKEVSQESKSDNKNRDNKTNKVEKLTMTDYNASTDSK